MKPFDSLGLKFVENRLLLLDQRLLPHEVVWIDVRHPKEMVTCIQTLATRGAPLIGVSAAASLALYAENGANRDEIAQAAQLLRSSRPTAVNLVWAIDKMLETDLTSENLSRMADEIIERETLMCDQMGEKGSDLIQEGESILTHCNTGGLATCGIGTALGVIRRAHEKGKNIHVYVDETRPLLQGGRLTTWELEQLDIPYTLICDNMAAALMRDGKIQRVLTGADRVAVNGDFANKIGTYSAAVNAHHHGIPFHPVAPLTTVDPHCPTGKEIPIEERQADEVRGLANKDICWAPKTSPVYNPAFDVTPVELVTSLILDEGVLDQRSLINGELKQLVERSETHVGNHRRNRV